MFGQQGDSSQTEEVDEENKGLIWMLVKQVMPGEASCRASCSDFLLSV